MEVPGGRQYGEQYDIFGQWGGVFCSYPELGKTKSAVFSHGYVQVQYGGFYID